MDGPYSIVLYNAMGQLIWNHAYNNGRIGKMSAFNVLDATAYHRINSIGATFNLSVKNLTDERYISTRRPEGIRVGLPRFVTLGFEIKF